MEQTGNCRWENVHHHGDFGWKYTIDHVTEMSHQLSVCVSKSIHSLLSFLLCFRMTDEENAPAARQKHIIDTNFDFSVALKIN